jgi:hypothetical protein
MYFLFPDIGIEMELPIVVKADNIGAIFMSQNASIGVRTRQVDIRNHVEDGIIKVEFVKLSENNCNILTKNKKQEIYEKHVKKFLCETREKVQWMNVS